MARRALPKIRPDVDYSAHLLDAKLLADWNPAAWFKRDAPLEIEVGCGKGLFLRNFPPRRPEHNFLGIEISAKYTEFAAYRCAKNGIDNVRLAAADAIEIFDAHIPTDSVHDVHVYFPDPWWKKRHHKRRLLNEAFVRNVERTLISGGCFHFWTDVQEYFQNTLELVAAETNLSGPLEVPETVPEHPLDYRTHRERRVRLAGEPVYRSRFEKQYHSLSACHGL